MDGLNFVNHLANYIGETVTVFTTSGGESGAGFTGVLLSVNSCYIRLITQIGIAPGCALGNCCERHEQGCTGGTGVEGQYGNQGFGQTGVAGVTDFDGQNANTGRFTCRGNTVGSVADIPIDRIAAFVHNAV